jgi:uncharacterized RDD family membrane protein YckC
MSDNIRINTTQNVQLNFELASLGDRMAASLIDMVILWSIVISLIWGLGYSSATMEIAGTIMILYHPLLEIINNGRSIGKMILKTKVVRMDGTEPSIGDYTLRGLLGIVELLGTQGTVAMIAFLVNGKGQRLGDVAAGTTVAKMAQGVTLEQTLFEDVKTDYAPAYREVEQLTDLEVETIKEVLYTKRNNYTVETIMLIEKTKTALEKKLNIKSAEPDSVAFLERLIKDYNYITGNL